MLINNIEVVFNCLQFPTLHHILQHYRLPSRLVNTIIQFTMNRRVAINIDDKMEALVEFRAGLPQGSPLFWCLFIIYASVLSIVANFKAASETTYMDDQIMIQLSPSQPAAIKSLQRRLDLKLARTLPLNIKYCSSKTELMHLIPITNKSIIGYQCSITLYGKLILPHKQIKSLVVRIDYRLSFKTHAAVASSKARGIMAPLWKITKRKCSSLVAIYHLCATSAIPMLLWGSEAWWTGVRHVLDSLAATYQIMTRTITVSGHGLPHRRS